MQSPKNSVRCVIAHDQLVGITYDFLVNWVRERERSEVQKKEISQWVGEWVRLVPVDCHISDLDLWKRALLVQIRSNDDVVAVPVKYCGYIWIACATSLWGVSCMLKMNIAKLICWVIYCKRSCLDKDVWSDCHLVYSSKISHLLANAKPYRDLTM